MTREGSRGVSQELARDRIMFVLLVFLLTCFGILMVYSASSISSITSPDAQYDSLHYLKNQVIYAAAGAVCAAIVAYQDQRRWTEQLLIPLTVLEVVMLLLVFIPPFGVRILGASRWFHVGPVQLQPSEFAKPLTVVATADLLVRRNAGEDMQSLIMRGAIFVGVPLALIFFETDKGTVAIIAGTILAMCLVAGFPWQVVAGVSIVCILALLAIGYATPYSRERMEILNDPWIDRLDRGYQMIQGLYAFACGGLFGVGLGNSRQKYSYLPMAHTDFILAIVGEELGFVGLLGVMVVFLALVWLGLRIARNAIDLTGRLIAAGSVMTIALQLSLNALGVLKVIPLSGKPVPFLSAGGSSIISSMILAGLVVSVARSAEAASGSSFTVYEGGTRMGSASGGLRVIEGGGSNTPDSLRASQEFEQAYGGRVSVNANGSRRIDLGPSASERLRGRGSSRGGRG